MPTIIAEGFTTTTLGTTQTLATDSTNKIYVAVFDASPMQNGDVVNLYLVTKLSSQSTERVAYEATFAHLQAEPNKYSVPVPADVSIKYQCLLSAGTGRVYAWKLLSV